MLFFLWAQKQFPNRHGPLSFCLRDPGIKNSMCTLCLTHSEDIYIVAQRCERLLLSPTFLYINLLSKRVFEHCHGCLSLFWSSNSIAALAMGLSFSISKTLWPLLMLVPLSSASNWINIVALRCERLLLSSVSVYLSLLSKVSTERHYGSLSLFWFSNPWSSWSWISLSLSPKSASQALMFGLPLTRHEHTYYRAAIVLSFILSRIWLRKGHGSFNVAIVNEYLCSVFCLKWDIYRRLDRSFFFPQLLYFLLKIWCWVVIVLLPLGRLQNPWACHNVSLSLFFCPQN